LSEEEKGELKVLKDMLPLIAERLMGMQMDYVPRLKALTGGEVKEFVSVEEKRGKLKPSLLKMTLRGKGSICSFISTNSLASTSSSSLKLVSSPIKTYTILTLCSLTIINDSI
jgi:hypothetical protein